MSMMVVFLNILGKAIRDENTLRELTLTTCIIHGALIVISAVIVAVILSAVSILSARHQPIPQRDELLPSTEQQLSAPHPKRFCSGFGKKEGIQLL